MATLPDADAPTKSDLSALEARLTMRIIAAQFTTAALLFGRKRSSSRLQGTTGATASASRDPPPRAGRPREVPTLRDSQRQLLDAVRRLAGGGALIPPERNHCAGPKACTPERLPVNRPIPVREDPDRERRTRIDYSSLAVRFLTRATIHTTSPIAAQPITIAHSYGQARDDGLNGMYSDRNATPSTMAMPPTVRG